ncbi:MAG: L,D-transpeptidase family protein [Thermodesulfovibrionales bacterium]|jgi:L,D-transpeptidase ErfK/SrfK
MVLLFILSLLVTNVSASEPYTITEDTSVIGIVQTYPIKGKESLIEVARSFNLGYNEIIAANPDLDPFIPGDGTEVIIPSSWVLPDRDSYKGIVVNISEMRLYYFMREKGSLVVRTYPIGIGDEGNDTPVGSFRIIEKIANPAWHVPKSIKAERPFEPDVVPPGPNNPLGTHALRLSLGSYLIHGTNRPWAVGRRVTHGCIRLYPEDIPRVFDIVPNGTAVDIVRQPVKAGLRDGKVYLEVHRDDQEDFNYLNEAVSLLRKRNLMDRVIPEKLYRAVMRKSGIPVVISGQ